MLEEPTSLRIDDPGVRALFTESARFQSWLDVEAALAEAQAALGIIPAAAAKEMRVFGLGDWFVGRYRSSFLASMDEIWATRRAGGAVAVAVAALMLTLEGGALALVARAGAAVSP